MMHRIRSLAPAALLGVAAAPFIVPTSAPAQSGLVMIDQVPRNVSSPAMRRAAPPPPAARTGQIAPAGQPGAATTQLAARTNDTRVAAVPPQLVDACEKAQAQHVEPPKGVDCKSVLEASVPPPRRPTPEEALLGVAPAGTVTVVTTQRTNLPDANSVARRLGSGDVQGAPIAEAVGAIAQQQNGGSPR
jgi:hypothetical protein